MILQPQAKIDEYTRKGWWGTTTLDDLFRRNVAQTPDAIALVDPLNRTEITDGAPQRLTYSQLDAAVNRLATRLLEQGIGRDDIIAVQLPNIVELVMVYLAAARIGVIVSPFPVQYREYEIEQLTNFVRAKAFLTAARIGKQNQVEMLVALKNKLPSVKRMMAWGESVSGGVVALNPLMQTQHDEKILANHLKNISVTANDIFTICWTSGTEAQPKGVPRSANEWIVSAYATVDASELTQGDHLLNPFPLVNMAGIGGMLVPWLLTGGKLVQHHPFNMPVFLQQIAVEKIHYTVAPPALLNMLLKNEQLLAQADISSIKTIGSGAAPLSPWMVKTWQDRYKIYVTNYFGSNEGTALVSGPKEIPDPEKRAQFFPRFGVVGFDWSARVSKCLQTKLLDLQTGTEITEPGKPGELLIKGASVLPGYYKADELNRRAFTADGFFHTGDVFEIAGDGEDEKYYRYIDRSKDIIIRGGTNISPAEIEMLLLGHPKIADVAVVGYPDEILGERAGAYVVTKPGEQITLEEIILFLNEKKVASYKLPERLVVVDALPRNPVGKVLKRDLRERMKMQAP